MLNDYKDKQAVTYNVLMNEINENHISHAYLFDENGYSESFEIVMAFIKEVLCNKISDECEKEILCRRIDEGNYPEIKVIEPDGMFIKKQQILSLQQDFSRMAVEGSKRIYIIRDADKMRSETANSMLKFLEEPENDVMAILMTNNYNNMLSTIISRCQIIRLNNDKVENNNELDEIVINLIKEIENNGIRSIVRIQELLFDKVNVKDREKIIDVFDKMIEMYYDIMKLSAGSEDIRYRDYMDILKEIAGNNTTEKITQKVNYLITAKETIKNNVNISLLVDSMIINIGGR